LVKSFSSNLIGILCVAVILFGAFGISAAQVVARGDGLEVTGSEVNALRQHLSKVALKPSRRSLVDLAVQNELFAREAIREKLVCPRSAEVKGLSRTVMLARCYLDNRLDHLGLIPGAVESYYRANWHDFRDKKTGKLLSLDADRRQWIKKRIVTAKKKKLAKEEFKALCKKYNVVFSDGGSR